MTGCNHPGCAGTVDETGFCDTCLEPPLRDGEVADPAAAPPRVPGLPDDVTRAGDLPPDAQAPGEHAPSLLDSATSWWAENLVDLPRVSVANPHSAIIPDPRIPEERRHCHQCGAEIGRGHHGQPALQEGVCHQCGRPYSYIPRLGRGEVLEGRYEIAGCVGHGGVGWIFLAWDRNLEGQPVVVKGLIDTDDPSRAATVINERKFLIQVDHPNIVGILDFVEHPPHADDRGGHHGYIVMEFVGGHTLQQVIEAGPGGMSVERAIAYCLQVLKALSYMHRKGLGFGDLSLGNVMVIDRQVKLIDLGAVTTLGSRALVYTEGFASISELRKTGVTVHTDLYALGCILRQLFQRSADFTLGGDYTRPPVGRVGPGIMSLRRFIRRCTAADPDRRFASAGEAASQLSGVLHEIVALREGKANAAPALLFSPAQRLLDNGLGSVPKIERWLTREAQQAAAGGTCLVLPDGAPDPGTAAAGLPVPRADPAAPGAGFVAQLSDDAPAVVLDRLRDFKTASVEAAFARCRAHLRLAQVGPARTCLDGVADGPVGVQPERRDWRLTWHLGLVALAEGRLKVARQEFDAVYDALPGEEAPKLALAMCAEYLDDFSTAERMYATVWRTDRAEVSAAFGLARIKMGIGQRDAAIAVLDEVRPESRHYDAARIAVIRISAGLLAITRPAGAGGETAAPGGKEVAEAIRLLRDPQIADLGRDAAALLQAEVWEAALALVCRVGPDSMPNEENLGAQPSEKGLRKALEKSFREFASWEPEPHRKRRTVLVDLANKVRPRTLQ